MARFSDIQEVIDKILRPTFFFAREFFFRRYNDVGKEGGQVLNGWYLFFPPI